MTTPTIHVGIIQHAPYIRFTLHGTFRTASGRMLSGTHRAAFAEGALTLDGETCTRLTFTPADETASFTLEQVTIGHSFHWQRQEDQTFTGSLTIIPDADGLTAINDIDVESYLTSVISSEMRATSAPEFLKAHAVISRSWLLAQIGRRRGAQTQAARPDFRLTDDEHIRWHDREDHDLFDVCADDHCQRYQGITRAMNPAAAQAISETRGQVLADRRGHVCDARFSKCCGGASEHFAACWDDRDPDYLQPVRDCPPPALLPDLTREDEARRWMTSAPEAFCHTDDPAILSQILNDYDRETTPDFYRWTVRYTQAELSRLLRERTGTDFGAILDLTPLERGASGRIVRLRVVGERRSLTIGKELEIRRALSPTHLFSSAFVVDRGEGMPPQEFTLHGAGWGHGVGLCQIGAAVMGARGYSYRDILAHYYRNTQLLTLY